MQLSTLLSAGSWVSEALFLIALLFLLVIILLGILLIVPFYLSIDLCKKETAIQGKFRVSFLAVQFVVERMIMGAVMDGKYSISLLGLTLKRDDYPPRSVGDLLASISEDRKKDENEDEERDEEEKNEGKDSQERSSQKRRIKGKADQGNETGDSGIEQKSGTRRMPKLESLLDAAPGFARVLRDLLRLVTFRKLRCRLSFGLDDPSETALISGYLWSMASALSLFRADIFIEPCYEGERLEGEFLAEIRVRLLWIPAAIFDALREKEIRSLIREMIGWD